MPPEFRFRDEKPQPLERCIICDIPTCDIVVMADAAGSFRPAHASCIRALGGTLVPDKPQNPQWGYERNWHAKEGHQFQLDVQAKILPPEQHWGVHLFLEFWGDGEYSHPMTIDQAEKLIAMLQQGVRTAKYFAQQPPIKEQDEAEIEQRDQYSRYCQQCAMLNIPPRTFEEWRSIDEFPEMMRKHDIRLFHKGDTVKVVGMMIGEIVDIRPPNRNGDMGYVIKFGDGSHYTAVASEMVLV